jgi:hypothetical protein
VNQRGAQIVEIGTLRPTWATCRAFASLDFSRASLASSRPTSPAFERVSFEKITKAISLAVSAGVQRSPPPRLISRCMRKFFSSSSVIDALSFAVCESFGAAV